MGAEPWCCLHRTVCEAIQAAWGGEAHNVPGHIVCSTVCSTSKCAPCAAKRAAQRSVQHPTACSTLQDEAQHPTACRAACSTLQPAAQHPTPAPFLLATCLQLPTARWAPARSPLWEQHRPAPSPCSGMGTPSPVWGRTEGQEPVGPGCARAGRVLGAASPARSP